MLLLPLLSQRRDLPEGQRPLQGVSTLDHWRLLAVAHCERRTIGFLLGMKPLRVSASHCWKRTSNFARCIQQMAMRDFRLAKQVVFEQHSTAMSAGKTMRAFGRKSNPSITKRLSLITTSLSPSEGRVEAGKKTTSTAPAFVTAAAASTPLFTLYRFNSCPLVRKAVHCTLQAHATFILLCGQPCPISCSSIHAFTICDSTVLPYLDQLTQHQLL